MATYECSKCGMSVNATCAKCDAPLVDDMLTSDDGREVQISKCPNDHGKIKSPMCCGEDMSCPAQNLIIIVLYKNIHNLDSISSWSVGGAGCAGEAIHTDQPTPRLFNNFLVLLKPLNSGLVTNEV